MEEPIFVILLNYHGEKDTIECLESLLANNYKGLNICVADNGSSEESIFIIKNFIIKNCKEFEVVNIKRSEIVGLKMIENKRYFIFLENEENLGFAKGNNIPAKMAMDNGFENILLLNNDTIVEPDFLKKMLDFKRHYPEYWAYTPKICLANPKTEIWNCGGKITWFKNRKYYFAGKNIKDTPSDGHLEITFITGCALLFNPIETGLLTEDFFFGEEDFEFSLRLKKRKKKMACINNVVIYHKVGSSVNKESSKIEKKAKVHYINRFIDLKKYFPKMWKIYFLINGFYAFFMMMFKHHVKIYDNIKFWQAVYYHSKTKKQVTREDFLNWIK